MSAPKLSSDWAGSISFGTLKTEDLLDAFMGVLREFWPERAQIIDLDLTKPPSTWEETDEAWQALVLIEDVMPAMEEIAPDGYYFGTCEGDGADFGYWPEGDE